MDVGTFEDLSSRLPEYIEVVFNTKRLHSSLGYLPPGEFEAYKLPNPDPNPTYRSREAVQAKGCTPKHAIMVVDDDRLVRETYLAFSQTEAFAVVEATNGVDALQGGPADLILLELQKLPRAWKCGLAVGFDRDARRRVTVGVRGFT